ncbi:uncharacterized protein LOC129765122 isoform X2 [Toxorhynchites rutilus septentrionalis]|uniref:uncharacterized protein LOC129765122 isoform X2 n=1 Tax=Toxorhynchites rutilus septentrionalis TaxID=329112 RepID=UPI002478FC9C|nr:uncharacterized protein LOC129765122 isoform X2 [Toxorhynchites rutilus septentrionalis]
MDTAYSAEIINKFTNMNLRNRSQGFESNTQNIFNSHRQDRPKTAFVPAIGNFQTARKMAQENLEHQPLPDAVMDIAFRKAQVAGSANPGFALEVGPYATGVGCKNYKAGPTKCTKYRVYRPKTCGVIPKPLSASGLNQKPLDLKEREKNGAMDLAIGWDYRPKHDPHRTIYMDGSKPSVAPPIFEVVEPPKDLNLPNVVHTGGVFSNTLGEGDFFNRDIIRQHDEYTKTYNLANRCKCNGSAKSAKSAKNIRPASSDNMKDPKSGNSGEEIDAPFADELPDLKQQQTLGNELLVINRNSTK